jgi:tetratricopeptide (TPR) repeat protein
MARRWRITLRLSALRSGGLGARQRGLNLIRAQLARNPAGVCNDVSLTTDQPTRRALLAEAVAALEARDFSGADAVCDRLLAADSADVEALLLRGLALAGSGEVVPAASVLNCVAAARPNYAHPCQDLDGILDGADFTRQVRTCLGLTPGDPRLQLLWADCLHRGGDLKRAVATLVALLEDSPETAAAHHRLGLLHAELGDFDAAIGYLLRAVAHDPQPALGWGNLGMLLKVQGRFAESLRAYDAALRRAPQDARLRVNRVVALLHAGRFAEAWPDHGWRFVLAEYTGLPLNELLPPLATQPDLAGRTVLLTHEAGYGDTLQFCRYVPLLTARGARIVLAVPLVLQRLLGARRWGIEVLPTNAEPSAYDWHCPMMSLPSVFGTTLETIPAAIPYLTADPALVASWAARLPSGPGLRVGLVWAGQARPWLPGFASVDGRRSTGLAQFAPFGAVEGVRFVSLQAGAPTAEARDPSPGLALYDPMPEVADFADTAAIIANLDLVVSVDTSVSHLAGALGKPVLLLDRYDNCWRWLSGRTDSPWYPTLCIFRQTKIGEWAPVMQQAAAALAEFVAGALRSPARTGAQ